MTSLIDADDLIMLRAAQGAYLPDTCTILSAGTARTSSGGLDETETTVSSSVPCRFRIIQPGQRGLHGEAVVGDPQYVLTLAHDQALTIGQRISTGGITYNVQSVNTGDSHRTALRATLIPFRTRPL